VQQGLKKEHVIQAGSIYCSNPSAFLDVLSLANGSPSLAVPKRRRTGRFHLLQSKEQKATGRHSCMARLEGTGSGSVPGVSSAQGLGWKVRWGWLQRQQQQHPKG